MRALPVALLLLIPSLAHADILLLEGGGRIEGVVTEDGKALRVEAVHGSALRT